MDTEEEKQVVGSGVEEKVPEATKALTNDAERATQILTRAKALTDKWVELAQSEVDRVRLVKDEWSLLQSLVDQVKKLTHEQRQKLAEKVKEMGAM